MHGGPTGARVPECAGALSGRCQDSSRNARLHPQKSNCARLASGIQELEFGAVYEALVLCQMRNDFIFDDVLRSRQNGRRPVYDHVDTGVPMLMCMDRSGRLDTEAWGMSSDRRVGNDVRPNICRRLLGQSTALIGY